MKSELKCVMLIDDDDPTNFLNQWILQHSGFKGHIEVTEGGQQALEYLKESIDTGFKHQDLPFPDLIFLDINMPAMNGWEFLDRYRILKQQVGAETIIVMLTTTLFPEDISRANTIPEISGFESKPLTPEILEKIVKKHFKNVN